MPTLEDILLFPILLADGFIQYSPVFLYPTIIEHGRFLYEALLDNPNLVMDHAGSFLPVVWGTCLLNQISRIAFKKNCSYEYITPLITTGMMTIIEISQKYDQRVYDENDLYAGISGGVVSL